MERRVLTRADMVLIAALLAVSFGAIPVAAAWGRAAARPGAFRIDSTAGARFVAARGRHLLRVRGPLGFTTIELKGGRARILDSPCPQHLCVRRGWVSGAGRRLICAPNRIMVTLPGGAGSPGGASGFAAGAAGDPDVSSRDEASDAGGRGVDATSR